MSVLRNWQSVPASACRKTRTAKRRGISPTSRPVTYLTKMQERKRFIAEFARRLREARIYSLDEWRAARWAAVFGDDDGPEDTGR